MKQIEVNQYSKLNFDKRCQKWNEYVQAIEQNLSIIQANFHTNYHGLVEIDTNLSSTVNDFNQRQQELIQLVNEGKQLIDDKILKDQDTFTKLEQRWQKIMKTILVKQQDVKELIKLWLSYQNSLENYYRLLKSKYEHEQEHLQNPTLTTLHQIQQGFHSNATQNHDLKTLVDKVYDINRRLIASSDVKTQAILEKEWNDLQKAAQEIDLTLKQRSDILLSV